MKKGFTLVELLAVLVVLGLIGLLVYPAIEKTIKGVRKDLYETQKVAIIDGVKNWVADHPRSLPEANGEIVYVSLGQLKIGSYVDMNISNPKTDKLFDNATKVIIKRENNKYKYDVLLDDTSLVEEEKRDNITYPKVEVAGDLVVHLSIGTSYLDDGIIINDNLCKQGSCSNYNGDVSFDSSNIDISTAGSYYVKYTVFGQGNLVLYRTVIVK